MCGIIGYLGTKHAKNVLLTGLKRMEYRGYDSAGIATQEKTGVKITKSAGAVSRLEEIIEHIEHKGKIGIGHTRWATHGEPSDSNAHPHQVGSSTVVHNGIIENYQQIKSRLSGKGYVFLSETDTEVIAALIDDTYKNTKDITQLFIKITSELQGTFGLAVLISDVTDTVFVLRRSSPVLIAQSKDAVFIASDQYALTGHAKNAVLLQDEELAICKRTNIEVIALDNQQKKVETIDIQDYDGVAQHEGYEHFMKKEIFEQPKSINRTISGRINNAQKTGQLGGLNLTNKQLRGIKSLMFVGCGTAYNAGLTAKYLLEPLIKIPISVEVASELRYRNAPFSGGELAVAISQSGETADTIACVEELKLKGIPVLGVVNVIGSTLARLVDGGTYIHAGPEISVASTKAFTSQVTTLLLLGLHLARQREMTFSEGAVVIEQIKAIPNIIEDVLLLDTIMERIAAKLASSKHIMLLGRDTLYPIALETALKIKEITYIPTNGYPAGEMKHGPNALLGPDMSVIYLLGRGPVYEKSLSNLAEVRSRDAMIVVLTDNPDYVAQKNEDVVQLPYTGLLIQPLVHAVAGQILAYHMANILHREIDKPRNLAKSVTVE